MALLWVMPLCFSSNIIFGRAAVSEVEPFTLALLRWSLASLLILPFVWRDLAQLRNQLRSLALPLLVMGFFGMWVCGALVYLALKYTTATNGTLIYTSSPVMIIVLDWLLKGRPIRLAEAMGTLIALSGVVLIVVQASWTVLTSLQFNAGDLLFVAAALSWALYSVGIKRDSFDAIPTFSLFFAIAAAGSLLLLPFALVEIWFVAPLPVTSTAWANIIGIVVFASLLAFSLNQIGIRTVGAATTGVFLYLLPIYGVGLAILFLGEELAAYHLAGMALVLGGVVLATYRFGKGEPAD